MVQKYLCMHFEHSFLSFLEIQELVPPIMNEKKISLLARVGDPLVLACVAYANPKPTYR